MLEVATIYVQTGVRIITEKPGSVATGTLCIILNMYNCRKIRQCMIVVMDMCKVKEQPVGSS